MSDVDTTLKADPVASAIFKALADGEKCICELKEAIGIPQTWPSYDLMMLENLNAIKSRSVNGWKHYSLGENRTRWYLRRYMLSEESTNRPVEYIPPRIHRRLPQISEVETVLRRGC